jgi:hypothetical protein
VLGSTDVLPECGGINLISKQQRGEEAPVHLTMLVAVAVEGEGAEVHPHQIKDVSPHMQAQLGEIAIAINAERLLQSLAVEDTAQIFSQSR